MRVRVRVRVRSLEANRFRTFSAHSIRALFKGRGKGKGRLRLRIGGVSEDYDKGGTEML